MNKKTLKSIWAVLAGILIIVILSVGTDSLLEGMGYFPSPTAGLFDRKLLLIALLYRTIYAYIGGYVTAKLSPSNSIKHVKILLGIGTIMGILGVIGGWNLSEHWYPIALVVTSAIAVWYGGKLGMKKE